MKTKMIMYFVGDNKISRKEKKQLKGNVKNRIFDIYKQKIAVKSLKKIPILTRQKTSKKNGATIYSEIEITQKMFDILFPKKISKKSNYFLGKLNNVLYFFDVDDLFFEAGEYKIWPSEEKKTVYLKII